MGWLGVEQGMVRGAAWCCTHIHTSGGGGGGGKYYLAIFVFAIWFC